MELNDIMTVAHEPEKTNGKVEDGTEKHSIIVSFNVWDTRKRNKKIESRREEIFRRSVRSAPASKRKTAAVAAASSIKQQVAEHRII